MKSINSMFRHAVVGFFLCLAAVNGNNYATAAITSATTWSVEIDVFSGRPNPVFTLQESEVAQVQALLAKSQTTLEPRTKQSVFPSKLGYRGIFLRQVRTNQTAATEFQIRGKNVLQKSGAIESWQGVPDAALEQYLVDLALAKGAIKASVHGSIRETMAKNTP